MNAAAILEELRVRGVELSVEGDRLSIRAPQGTLTDSLRTRLAELKHDIMELLRRPATAPRERFEPFPLTDIQQAYWVGRGNELDLGGVGCFAYREFDGVGLDPARLEAAWQRVVDRHDMLRAIVLPDGRQQVLADVEPYRFAVIDLRGRNEAETEAKLELLRRELAQRVLPADRWPLFDIRLTLRDNGRVRVHFGIDLLIADAAGLFQLLREWGRFYHEPGWNPPALSRSFREYVLETEGRRTTSAYRTSEAYWRDRLNDLAPSPPLPLLLSSGTAPYFVRRSVRLPAKEWVAFRERCATVGLTPSGALAAAYADVLGRWSDSARFTLAVTLFDRPPEMTDVVGDFTTTVLLEADTTADTFAARGQASHRRLTADMEHRAVSGVRVLRERNRRQVGGAPDLMPVAFTSGLGHRGSSPSAWLGEPAYSLTQTPQLALDHIAVEESGELLVAWDAREEVFPPGLLDSMFEAYSGWLRRLATDPDLWNAPLRPELPKGQQEQLTAISNTVAPFPEGLLHERFFQQARQRPDAPAVITPDRTLTYGELSLAAEAWGEHLRELGAEPDSLVAVVLPKGWEQAVAVFGVLRSGAAYLPIDPEWPADRRRRLLALGRVRFVLTNPELDRTLEWPADVRRLCITQAVPTPLVSTAAQFPARERRNAEETSLAYVIFTSGSTGEPKGVMVEHRAALNTVIDINQRFGVTAADRVLGLSALTFDLSVYDLFGPLSVGGAVVFPDPAGGRDPGHWLELIGKHGVTLWNTVPILMQMLVEYAAGKPLAPSLRLVMLSGDWIPVDLPSRVKQLGGSPKVVSLGGATEAAIWSIFHPVEMLPADAPSVPYGRPLLNQRVYVLDHRFDHCPTWVPGRLFISGEGLARGYWGDAELTARKFFAHPVTGERLYDTGDRGRYLPSGDIEFLGRADYQVKVRGHRIELGEIEAVLRSAAGVKEAIASAIGDPKGDRRLVAYVVRDTAIDVNRAAFKFQQRGIRAVDAGATVVPLGGDPNLSAAFSRRTVRTFQDGPVPLNDVAAILGELRPTRVPGRALPKYRYPSAGDLYPVQAYLHVKPGGVVGLAPGTYYYHPLEHALVPLTPDAEIDRETHAPNNRRIFDDAAFGLFLVGRLSAVTPIYGDVARDFCLLEAGYIGQLLMTAAPGCRLGLCPIGGMDFDRVRALFQLEADDVFLHGFLAGAVSELTTEAEPELSHVPGPELIATAEGLKSHVRSRLPEYMVPSDVLFLESVPLSANGKVDRSALPTPAPKPTATAIHVDSSPSENELEKQLAAILRDVLAVPHVGSTESFFDLGANSFHLVQCHRRIVESLGCTVAVVDLFRHPTVRSLAGFLRQGNEPPPAVGGDRGAARRQARERRRNPPN